MKLHGEFRRAPRKTAQRPDRRGRARAALHGDAAATLNKAVAIRRQRPESDDRGLEPGRGIDSRTASHPRSRTPASGSGSTAIRSQRRRDRSGRVLDAAPDATVTRSPMGSICTPTPKKRASGASSRRPRGPEARARGPTRSSMPPSIEMMRQARLNEARVRHQLVLAIRQHTKGVLLCRWAGRSLGARKQADHFIHPEGVVTDRPSARRAAGLPTTFSIAATPSMQRPGRRARSMWFEPYMSRPADAGNWRPCSITAEGRIRVLDFVPHMAQSFPLERFRRRGYPLRGKFCSAGITRTICRGFSRARRARKRRKFRSAIHALAPASMLARDSFPLVDFNVEDGDGASARDAEALCSVSAARPRATLSRRRRQG